MFVVLFQCISKLKDLTCGFTPPYVALLLALLLTLFFAAVTPMQCNYLFFILHFFLYLFSRYQYHVTWYGPWEICLPVTGEA